MRQCWVIPNGRGEPWVIDTDETKPVYLKNGIPTYKDGEMFNYHLANEPRGEERCQEIEKGCEGYQFTFEDFIQEDPITESQDTEIDFSCFASYVTYPGAGVRFGECPFKDDKPKDCKECDAHIMFYKAVEEERKNDKSLTEAHYNVHQRFNIPTAYDEKGRIKNG